ncbi:unnamed protein product [Caenorhabditis sp. 36 PRJEB53466]|nr:unnamed protein product [Caenorhabditis sp. 36 PRJEB53466]
MRVPLYVFIFAILGSVSSKLISVHVVFRHGARAPVLNVTSEEAKTYFYRGLGQLTDEGIEQAQLIGELLKDRYVDSTFIDAKMIPSQLVFRSSPVERCLMTIQTVGNVMFSNVTPPVQTVARDDDFLLLPKMDCPFLIDDYQKHFNLSEKEKNVARKHIWDISERALARAALDTEHLKNRSKENIPALLLEKEAGLAVPSWFNEEAYKEAKEVFYGALSVMSSVGDYYSPRGIRPKAGLLLNQIFEDINKRVNCYQENKKDCELKRFQAFSTHDILILSILEALGLRESVLGPKTPPEFMATLIIETRLIDGEAVVKVMYRKLPKDYNPDVVTGLVRNCPANQEFCPVKLFTSCCNDFLTSDAKTECYGPPNHWFMTPLSWIFIAVSLALLIVVAVLFLLLIRYKKRTSLNLKV